VGVRTRRALSTARASGRGTQLTIDQVISCPIRLTRGVVTLVDMRVGRVMREVSFDRLDKLDLVVVVQLLELADWAIRSAKYVDNGC
jgi:hypothetical protein